VIASLANAKRAIGFDSEAAITKWLQYTRANLLDQKTELIVSWVGAYGEPVGSARGSYVAWTSFYLPFALPEFAREQYGLLKRHMLQKLPFGAAGLREFPHGERGVGDIDSGPVLFGLSTSGTGFAVGGARHNGDAETLDGLLRTAEIAGSSYHWNGKRAYLLAPLIGEAIMLAMKTARVWDTRYL
jgi:hypothetical protein